MLESLTRYNQQLAGEYLAGESPGLDKTVPIPRPYAYCTDKSIVGAEFYIMQYVHGRIFVDPRMKSMGSKKERAEAYRDAIRVLTVRIAVQTFTHY